MDADASAAAGLRARGVQVKKVCDWHDLVAIEEALGHSHQSGTCSKNARGSGKACSSDFSIYGKMLGAFVFGKRICLRAKSQEMLDELAAEFKKLARSWAAGGLLPFPLWHRKMMVLEAYLDKNLGITGTAWSGSKGDVPGSKHTTNNRVESHNHQIDEQLFQSMKGSSMCNLSSKLLGIDKSGRKTEQKTYFGHFNRRLDENSAEREQGCDGFYYRRNRDLGSYSPPLLVSAAERQRMMVGAFLVLTGNTDEDAGGDFFVKRGVTCHIRKSGEEEAAAAAAVGHTKDLDFSGMFSVLRGTPAPKHRDGWYNATGGVCLEWCFDALRHGRHWKEKCKHAHASLFAAGQKGGADPKSLYSDPGVFFLTAIRNRERNKPFKDSVLYNGSLEEVLAHLAGSGISLPAAGEGRGADSDLPPPPQRHRNMLAAVLCTSTRRHHVHVHGAQASTTSCVCNAAREI